MTLSWKPRWIGTGISVALPALADMVKRPTRRMMYFESAMVYS